MSQVCLITAAAVEIRAGASVCCIRRIVVLGLNLDALNKALAMVFSLDLKNSKLGV